jgi:prolyl-tRNA editing enzyme YbaK/EbsC (Cys-tRNA(Pro) deacylase)
VGPPTTASRSRRRSPASIRSPPARVPPVGHARAIDTVVDEDLLRYDVVWAAAGTPRAVFAIAPDRLVAISGARVARISPGA